MGWGLDWASKKGRTNNVASRMNGFISKGQDLQEFTGFT
jgi:hypothetical protein